MLLPLQLHIPLLATDRNCIDLLNGACVIEFAARPRFCVVALNMSLKVAMCKGPNDKRAICLV